MFYLLFISVVLLSVHQLKGIVIRTGNNSPAPSWATRDNCVQSAEYENFLFCDPEKTVNDDLELSLVRQHMSACFYRLNRSKASYHQITTVVVAVETITLEEMSTNVSNHIEEWFLKSVTQWFNLTKQPSMLAVVQKTKGESTEWHTEAFITDAIYSLSNSRITQFNELKGSFYSLLLKTHDEVCNFVEELYAPRKGISESLILSIILGISMFLGTVIFVIWIYKFNKSHPTDGCHSFELNEWSDEKGACNTGQSGYVLSKCDMEVATHRPANMTDKAEPTNSLLA